MEKCTTIGIDLGDQTHAVCVLDGRGRVVSEGVVDNTLAALKVFAAAWPGARTVLEAGTHSPWISRLLERAGHTVIVANPRKVRLIWQRGRKSDKSDAQLLARLGRVDPELLAGVRHRSEQQQADLAVLHARELLVKSRTALINHVRGAVKALGGRLPRCAAESFARRVAAHVPALLAPALGPLLATLEQLNAQIRAYAGQIEALARARYPQAQRVRQVPGVGPITALAWVLVLGDAARFADGRRAGAYVGLVPRRDQSGACDPQLRISKMGNGLLRRLLVSAAHYVLGPFGPDGRLRRWGLKLAERGGKNGKKRAVVATARKLSVILWRLWKSDVPYDPWYGVQPADAQGSTAA